MKLPRLTSLPSVGVVTFFVFFLLPSFASASIPFWGPIIPPAATDPLCAAGWGLVVEVINRIIQFSVTVAIAIVAPIMITWAGALLVTSGGSPGARTKAKSMLLSTVVGIVVALSAWLIVNALMAVLYNPAPDPSGRVTWPERWYNLIVMTGASDCIPLKASLDEADLNTSVVGTNQQTGAPVYSGEAVQCAPDNEACGVPALEAAGFDTTSANVMSCIAMTENSGQSAGCNGNACGTFQIMLSLEPLRGSACSAYPVTNCLGPEACNSYGGSAHNLSSEACRSCIESEKPAANDPQCNAQTAYAMWRSRKYAPWTSASDNTKSGACIATYGNG